MTQRDREIVEAYEDGKTQREIAERFRISQPRVARILKLAGISWRDGGAHVRARKRDSQL